MAISPYAKWMLAQEARALLTRLARVKPFVLQESMLPAAGLLPASQTAIENFLTRGRRYLQQRVQLFLQWLESPQAILRDTEDAQRSDSQDSPYGNVENRKKSPVTGQIKFRRLL